jgi:hypothetical protein
MLDPLKESLSPDEEEDHADGSVFSTQQDDGEETGQDQKAPDNFEELPIEIRSLTERCRIFKLQCIKAVLTFV